MSTSATSAVHISRAGLRVRLESPLGSALPDYADVVYPPYFTVEDRTGKPASPSELSALVRLHLLPGDELDAEARRIHAAPGGRHVPLEKYRTGTVVAHEPDGVREVADAPGHFTYRSDPRTRVVDVWGSDRGRLLLEGIRLARTVLVGLLVQERAHVPLHASCVAVDGRAVVFTGDSGAGKTTSAIAAMRYLGAELITNDLLLIDPGTDGGPAQAVGIPLQVRMAAGTLRSMDLLRHLDPYDEVFPFVEPSNWTERDRKIEVSARRVASWFGTSPLGSAPLACLVWPQLALGASPGVTELSPGEVPERIRSCVTYFDPAWPVWTGFGYRAPQPLPPRGERFIDELAGHRAVELSGAGRAADAIRALGEFLGRQPAGAAL